MPTPRLGVVGRTIWTLRCSWMATRSRKSAAKLASTAEVIGNYPRSYVMTVTMIGSSRTVLIAV
jgi:hypothetical protein